MNAVNVKWKKLHPLANVTQAHEGDAGFDLVACDIFNTFDGERCIKVTYSLGMSVEIPPGYVGMIFPRSSIHKNYLSLANSVGIVDSSYRGELKAVFYVEDYDNVGGFAIGERCCQMIIMPYPKVTYSLVDQFDNEETVRGTGGFGSSGK
jgi:dUTP pyrophosphatase